MNLWDSYPDTYRYNEVQAILKAVRAGDSAVMIGLSGSGKSNLIGFLTHREAREGNFVAVDCNRMTNPDVERFHQLLASSLGLDPRLDVDLQTIEDAIERWREKNGEKLCFLIDRLDGLPTTVQSVIMNNLRAIRDHFKYQVSLVLAVRHIPESTSELAELFFGRTIWLGPLTYDDARWSIRQYTNRQSLAWNNDIENRIIELSGGYPSFLRAICESYNNGIELSVDCLRDSSPVKRRLEEFWADLPSQHVLQECGLLEIPILQFNSLAVLEPKDLTAKEHLLFEYLKLHAGVICEKDDLLRAVWPEDSVYEKGLRDDSLAQLVRRLRQKIEVDPTNPARLMTVAGRGYRFIK